MARRKKQYLSDGDDDSSQDSSNGGEDAAPDWDEDPDERAERLKFSDPYGKRSKRKRDGKEEPLYGVWAEEGEGSHADVSSRGNKSLRRSQTFVPSTNNIAQDKPSTDSYRDTLAMDIPDFQAPTTGGDNAHDEDKKGSSAASSEDEDEVEQDGASSNSEEEDSSDAEEDKGRVVRHRSEEEDIDEVAGVAIQSTLNGDTARPILGTKSGLGAGGAGGMSNFARARALREELSGTLESNPVASTSSSGPDSRGAPASESAPSTTRTSGMAAAKERRAFLGASIPAGQAAPRKPAVLPKEEQKHFNNLAAKGGFGFELLKKMGWSAGSGLGAGGEGMVTPLESKLRPKAMGLAFEGFSERTKQAKQEEKRRKKQTGELASEDDDEDEWGRPKRKEKKNKAKDQKEGNRDAGPPAWKQKKARKPKVQHMTYEDMLAAGDASAPQAGVGAIYDLSGKELSAAALSHGGHGASAHDVPSIDGRNLPELLHNLTMVCDFTKTELDNLVREARSSAERRKWLAREASRIRESAKANLSRIARLQEITRISEALQQQSSALAYDDRPYEEQIKLFSKPISELLDTATDDEFRRYKLDEIVVAALAPLLKRAWMEWDVLEKPTQYLAELSSLKKAFRCRQRKRDASNEVGLFGGHAGHNKGINLNGTPLDDPNMTAFESMLWSVWMPRVRSAINNHWSPDEPSPVLLIFTSWDRSGLLPDFLSDNILDQLVLPKLKRAVSDWSPPKRGKSRGAPLHHVIFPWLEHIGSRLDDVIDDSKRKVRGWIKTCKVRDGAPEGLAAWRDVIPSAEWENLFLQYIVPQLAVQLREDFTINPRQQDLTPLTAVLSWQKLLRPTVLSQLLETEFMPKFLDVLHTWLTSPGVNFEQVAEWYTWWKKEVFGQLQTLPAVEKGFAAALDLMNQAMSLGEDAKYRLKKPSLGGLSSAPSATQTTTFKGQGQQPTSRTTAPGIDPSDITFRTVVEDIAAENNLIFMPTGKSHESTGAPLFRISSGVDGKGGVTVYLRGDVAYAQDKQGAWKPIGVTDMVEQAKRR